MEAGRGYPRPPSFRRGELPVHRGRVPEVHIEQADWLAYTVQHLDRFMVPPDVGLLPKNWSRSYESL
jgi:hypothetical protein